MMATDWQLPPWLSPPGDRHPPVHTAAEPRVLQLSTRRIDPLVAYAILYEYEDVLLSSAPTTRLLPSSRSALEHQRRLYKLVRRLGGSRPSRSGYCQTAGRPFPLASTT